MNSSGRKIFVVWVGYGLVIVDWVGYEFVIADDEAMINGSIKTR